jgi:selenoprotein W-related protein
LAEKLISTYRPNVSVPHPITELTLQPSGGGRFEVTVDDELIYSKAATGQHADPDAIVEEVGRRLQQEQP